MKPKGRDETGPAVREQLGGYHNMYYVYLLKDTHHFYIGYTNNLRRRLYEHKLDKTFTTRRMQDPKLVYYEAYNNENAAKVREKKLKQFGSSYKGLIKRLEVKI